ncbi:hypothetical protein [Variovorax sp.]|uniref:hypothetical protein n=1 Tax=Variovorax sp. TaxID=1871043 RepID=UPI002D362C4B|nr:hypothetical protein [Variovorax sp.]HYP82134.1 hypothetical protein [Variovorax sp.]
MAAQEYAEYVSHADFCTGLAAGRMRVVVNPKLARRFVTQRLMLMIFLIPLIGVGVVVAMSGQVWAGGAIVAFGVILNRVLMFQAGNIVVQLALRDAKVYESVTQDGVMEVRRNGGA